MGDKNKTSNLFRGRGFTIVELLVVIVIIAILASITLISYTGINDRAKTAQALTNANAVQNIAEIYSTELGRYPDTVLSFADAITAKLPSTVTVLTPPSTLDSTNGATSILWTYDGTPGSSTGGTIQYWDFNTNAISTNIIRVGTGIGYVPPVILKAKVLVVAGGGGGGMDMGGGGGAGGVLYEPEHVLQHQSYAVVVGAGGAGAPAAGTNGQAGAHWYNIPASRGQNSEFDGITAIGGGAGGSSYYEYTPGAVGLSGGSGGGTSGYSNGGILAGGLGTIGQGNNGGQGGGQYYSGGGGGAGGAGVGSPSQPNGGIGVQNDINGTNYYWGGGGGGASYTLSTGGNGGAGGGGGGAVGSTIGGSGINAGSGGGGGPSVAQANTPGGNAGANTGGGGGGSAHYNSNNKGGDGGSGIVIISYPTDLMTATGGTITIVGMNTVHTFTSGGTFTVL